jgi:hypothetical protein
MFFACLDLTVPKVSFAELKNRSHNLSINKLTVGLSIVDMSLFTTLSIKALKICIFQLQTHSFETFSESSIG